MKLNNRLFLVFTFVCISILSAQSERKITRNGNSQYDSGNFVDAEVNYKKAIEENSNLLEAQFNLGDALVKQERFDEALASFDLVSSTTDDPELKANALHNKGNVLLQQQDLEGALESYKDALRVNPKDHQTRYNYAYAKQQLAEQQEQEDQEESEENQDDDNKEEGDENKDNQEKGDKKKEDSENQDQEETEDDKEQEEGDKQEEDENSEEDSEQDQKDKGQTDGEESEEQQDQQAKPKEDKMTAEEAMRLLEALKQEENKVQDKMKKYKIKGTKQKIEKDW